MRILVVEDNRDLAGNLVEYLSLQGALVDYAADGRQALNLVEGAGYDVLVVDVMMPGIDGFELCQQLRAAHLTAPLLFLTARDALDDKLRGFQAGGDDYLIKPFALPELWARLQALARRSLHQSGSRLQLADLTMDLDTMEARRGSQLLQLNPIGWKLLRCLLQRAPDVVSRETLEHEIWGDDFPSSDALRTHMYNLRRQLDKPFDQPLLHTVHGVGFALRGPRDGDGDVR